MNDLLEPGAGLPAAVAAALAAARIPNAKLGAARHAQLGTGERELYLWILRRFAGHGRPTRLELFAAATRLGVEPESALATLAQKDLVHLDQGGEISVAYPFSGRATAHRIRFPDGHEVFAMCALDALGTAPMFGLPIDVFSRDPLGGEQLHVRVAPDGAGRWQPSSAVVVTGATDPDADSCRGCCPVLNFFAAHANAERWLAEHGEVRGHVISVEDAIASGRAVFGQVFDRCERPAAGEHGSASLPS